MILKGDVGKLEIRILKRSFPETKDLWDANWLESEIRIEVPGFLALYGTDLRIDELQIFYQGLSALKNFEAQEAEFTTLERAIYLHCELLSSGNIKCRGIANNHTDNTLEFNLQTDLATLDLFIEDFKKILQDYPLLGDG